MSDNFTFQSVVRAGAGWTTVQAADGQTYTLKGTRAWRNNNPGNIEFGNFARSMGAIGTDGRFAVFPTYEAGRRAKGELIFNGKNYRNLSLQQAIYRYAPPSENNSSSYLRSVVASSGVSPSTPMHQISPAQRERILDEMERVEGFKSGQIVRGDGQNVPVPPRQSPSVTVPPQPVNADPRGLAFTNPHAAPGTPSQGHSVGVGDLHAPNP